MDIRAANERVMELMLRAGWLRNFTFTDEKGFHLGWSGRGGKLAQSLKQIILSYGLIDDARTLLIFEKLAHGEQLPLGISIKGKLDAEDALLWREAVAELGLKGDADGLLVLCHIIDGWAPGAATKIQFIPRK